MTLPDEGRDITTEEWREYDFGGRVYRIEKPVRVHRGDDSPGRGLGGRHALRPPTGPRRLRHPLEGHAAGQFLVQTPWPAGRRSRPVTLSLSGSAPYQKRGLEVSETKTRLTAKDLTDFRAWSDHPEDLSLLGPSPADVGLLLDECEELRAALSGCATVMRAWLDMTKADMRGDHENGMARFNSGAFMDALRRAEEPRG